MLGSWKYCLQWITTWFVLETQVFTRKSCLALVSQWILLRCRCHIKVILIQAKKNITWNQNIELNKCQRLSELKRWKGKLSFVLHWKQTLWVSLLICVFLLVTISISFSCFLWFLLKQHYSRLYVVLSRGGKPTKETFKNTSDRLFIDFIVPFSDLEGLTHIR